LFNTHKIYDVIDVFSIKIKFLKKLFSVGEVVEGNGKNA